MYHKTLLSVVMVIAFTPLLAMYVDSLKSYNEKSFGMALVMLIVCLIVDTLCLYLIELIFRDYEEGEC